MKARLVSYKDQQVDLAFALGGKTMSIGRDSGSMIQLPDGEVSKRHALLKQADDNWTIEDAGSRNGVYVNGQKVTARALKHGDIVKIGPYRLVFEQREKPSTCVPQHVIDISPESDEERTMPGR
jgi:pSer/pThr/pTyr-binding forkhead associated (FHA) protein